MNVLNTVTLAMCLAAVTTVHADDSPLRTTLEQRMPEFKIGKISPGPLPGLYEVVVNGINVIYTDKNGDLAIIGNVVDLKTKESLTQRRMDELAFIDFSQIPLQEAIVKVKGDGSRKLVVFSDPDCPFCRQLEQNLSALDNVTIYVMLYPLEVLHPGSRKKAEAVWCSADPAKAWDDLMLNGKEPVAKAGECKTPIDEISALARRLSITGTPGLVFQNGKLVPGVLKADKIESLLTAAKKS